MAFTKLIIRQKIKWTCYLYVYSHYYYYGYTIMKTEAEIQTEIQNYLASQGYLVTRINTIKSGWRKSYRIANNGKCSGFPDILALKNNKALLLEIKDNKGGQRATQKDFEKLCKETGNSYYLARSVLAVQEILKLEERQRD